MLPGAATDIPIALHPIAFASWLGQRGCTVHSTASSTLMISHLSMMTVLPSDALKRVILAGAVFTATALMPGAAAANDAAAGKQKAQSCVMCHGENGIAQMPGAPNLAGQPAQYLAEQLKQYRSGKRANEIMGVIAKPLSDQDIADLAAWYASIPIEVKMK